MFLKPLNSIAKALQECGTLWAWGHNQFGQLGDGTTENRYTPVKIMENVRCFAHTGKSNAAIKNDDTLWTWGFNSFGQLGNGDTENSYLPILVLDNVKKVRIGANLMFALQTNGNLLGWGWNLSGQLGDGTAIDNIRSEPLKVMGDVCYFSVASTYIMAIASDNTVLGWGHGETLSDDVDIRFLYPKKIMSKIHDVVAWDSHALAMDSEGILWGWGSNSWGKLGIGTFEIFHVSEPTKITYDGY